MGNKTSHIATGVFAVWVTKEIALLSLVLEWVAYQMSPLAFSMDEAGDFDSWLTTKMHS